MNQNGGYDKYIRPSLAQVQNELGLYGGPGGSCPTAPADKVTTQFYIDYLSVDQKSLDYTLEGFFRAYWVDERLKFNGTADGGCVDKLIFGDSSSLWTPDFYFEKAASVSLSVSGNGEMLTVSPAGEVFWSRQSRITLRCKMHFGNIPFDTQRCPYQLGLYSQLQDEVVLEWKANNGTVPNALANWQAASTPVWEVELKAEDIENEVAIYSSGNYTFATATLTFTRRAQGYVISYIVLAVFCVAMSYAGFYINPAATPGRVALAVITVLNVMGLFAAAKKQLPPFAYNTWLTDFMFISSIFNMVGFFEMAAVNFGMTLNAKYEKREEAAKAAASKQQAHGALVSLPADGLPVKARADGSDGGDPDEAAEGGGKTLAISQVTGLMPKPTASCWPRTIRIVRSMKDMDHTMRWLFPVCYLIFVMVMISQVGAYIP